MFGRKRTKIRRKGKPFQEIFDDTLRGALKNDPSLLKILAFKSAGFPDLLERTTPEYKRMMRLEKTVVNQALDQIEHDPEIRDRLVKQTISKIAGGNSIRREINNLETDPLIVRVMEVLKNRVHAGQITAPVTRESLIKIINEVGSGRKSNAAGAPNMVSRQKDIQSIIKPGPTAYPDRNTMLTVGNSLVDPLEFVTQLKQEVLAGVAEAQQLWNFLLTASSRQVSELLSSCRVQREDKEYVVAITSAEGKDWVNKIIGLVGQAASKS